MTVTQIVGVGGQEVSVGVAPTQRVTIPVPALVVPPAAPAATGYIAANSTYWAGADPVTIKAALDRLAAALVGSLGGPIP